MQNELKILESVSHPNIIRIHELLHDNNFYFIISEMARYGDLLSYTQKRGKLGLGLISETEVKCIAK